MNSRIGVDLCLRPNLISGEVIGKECRATALNIPEPVAQTMLAVNLRKTQITEIALVP